LVAAHGIGGHGHEVAAAHGSVPVDVHVRANALLPGAGRPVAELDGLEDRVPAAPDARLRLLENLRGRVGVRGVQDLDEKRRPLGRPFRPFDDDLDDDLRRLSPADRLGRSRGVAQPG
jgi:hypothetical protein